MNSVKIGTYQMDTAFGLYLPEYTIPAPAPQTKFVKIIGRDGSVDLSDAIGLHYDSRSWSLDFKCFDPTVNWHTLTSSVMNAIHGKRLNFEFDDDPDYFWTGRISVSSYVSTRGTGTLKVNITSDPFKYAKLSTIVTKTASIGTEYADSLVTFNNGLIYDLSADIEPTQDLHGYSHPWPAGGGVNKYDKSADHYGQGKFWNSATGELKPSDDYYGSPQIPITPNTQYSRTAGTSANIFYDSNGGYLSTTFTGGTFTSPANAYYVTFNIANNVNHDTVQFEQGASLSTYSPYSNICPISGLTGLSVYVSPTTAQADATTYAVNWTSQAGTVYGGTVDVVTGLLTVDRVKKSASEATNWKSHTALNDGSGYYIYSPGFFPANGTKISNSHKQSFTGTWENLTFGEFYGSTSAVVTVPPEANTLALAKTYLESIGTYFVYPLATPITYQLTPQEVEALVGTNNIWTSSGDVSVTVVTPETVTNNGLPTVPTVTASANMVLRWGNYSASVQQGTSTIPQLVLETGDNIICIIGTGNISFEWSEASL